MKRGRKKNPENVAPGSQPSARPEASVEPPAHLDEESKLIFLRVAATLADMKILTAGDVDIIASYAEVCILGRKHKRRLEDNGATFTTEKGYEGLAPDYLIWRDCLKAGQKILNDLGLTPASRTRVAAALADDDDGFAEFIARRNSGRDKEAEATRGEDSH